MANAAVVVPFSAAPALMQLDEPEAELQSYALRALDAVADLHWAEMAQHLPKLQALGENTSFVDFKLAALVSAKVLFHLGDLDQALEYALIADDLFSIGEQSEFSRTLRAKCIDEYIAFKNPAYRSSAPAASAMDTDARVLPPALETTVERILADCIARGEVEEAIGVGIEARRLDQIEHAISKGCTSPQHRAASLAYCVSCTKNLDVSKVFRNEILAMVAKLHAADESPDHLAIASCMCHIGDAKGVASLLYSLVTSKSEEQHLVALQIALDVVENDDPRFRLALIKEIPAAADAEETVRPTLEKVHLVLSGSPSAMLKLDFLCSKNNFDMYTLKKTRSSIDQRSSVCHAALVFANAIGHSGTAIDSFLRENLDWLARATSWNKFSATACLGVIHARRTSNALNLLSPYLSSQGTSSSAYSEGGGLYALGIISATGGTSLKPASSASTDVIDSRKYLLDALRSAGTNEIVQHGACLGLGLAAMANWDGESEENEIYDELKNVLFSDSAVAGEAAGLAMGLLALGSGSTKIHDEMLAYARETEHEKISRGLAMGIAMIFFGLEDAAADALKELAEDKLHILRYGAMYGYGLAYCGTANNDAISVLLRVAVSDVNDDVRRAAVTNIGFVLFRHPQQVPKVVKLLSDSCHAHVRYGSALALAVACAGTAQSSAVQILEKLSTDTSDFVRQGALIGLAMVYMQESPEADPKVAEIRKTLEHTVGDKHEEVMTKFGAILSLGLIDAGGRNCLISLSSRSGVTQVSSVIGLAMFTQFWYWFPFTHFIALALKPKALIAVNKDLQMPVIEIKNTSRSNLFSYPPLGPQEKPKSDKKAKQIVLSVTAKAKAREARKENAKDVAGAADAADRQDKMDVDSTAKPAADAVAAADKKEGDAMDVDGASKPEEKKPSAPSVLSNPCRVLPAQEAFLSWPATGRYQPLVKSWMSGVLVVRDTKPGEEESLVPVSAAVAPPAPPAGVSASAGSTGASAGSSAPGAPAPAAPGAAPAPEEPEEEEPGPPEPFEYTE